jgi:methylenetetrahydrofolate dehydrogenase (NADP+)/methenyltetrahydrofolate cyclohydrolase
MNQISGTTIAEEIILKLKALPKPTKFFGAVLVGDDRASLYFLKQKEKVAEHLGIEFRLYALPAVLTTDELRREIARLAGVKNCGGFIVQLPLPESVNRHYALNGVPKEKDADLLSEAALGAFYTERSAIFPPSVGTVEEILKREHKELRSLKVVLIGAGFLIGKPIGFWLQNRVSELTVLDHHVKDIHARLKHADVVISGAGVAHLFSVAHLCEDALVLDFGFNRLNGATVGDFNPLGAEKTAIRYTPTPGGTGPLVVAKLFENFYALNGRA